MNQRKRFEAHIRNEGNYSLAKNKQGEYLTLGARLAWKTWQAACPDDWQAVPDVANDEMLEEGVESLKRGQKLFGDNLTQIVSNIHEDMLAAAPRPEDV